MYESQDILRAVRQHPFQPFRLHVFSGETFAVRHPELILVTDSAVIVGTGEGHTQGAAAGFEIVGLDHVVKVEPVGESTI